MVNFAQAGMALRGGQAAQESQQNLEELTRQFNAAKALRYAVSNADPKNGQFGALQAYANQAKANGDMQTYMATQDAAHSLLLKANTEVAQAALFGVPEKEAEQRYLEIMGGNTFKPGSLEYGTDPESGKHMVSIEDPEGNRRLLVNDARGFLGMMMGPITWKKGDITGNPLTGDIYGGNPEAGATRQGGTYLENGPEAGKTVVPGTLLGTSKDANGNVRQYPINMGTGKTFGATPPPAGTTGGALPLGPKDNGPLAAINKVMQSYQGIWSPDPATGKIVATPEGNRRMTLAQQIYSRNRNLPPNQIAQMAMQGQGVKNPKTGKLGIRFNGQVYEYGDAPTTPTPQQGDFSMTEQGEDTGSEGQENGATATVQPQGWPNGD